MGEWLNLGQITRINALKNPNKLALKDKKRSFTFGQVDDRVNRLANALLAMGLRKGDKISVLLENSVEIIELYLAAAKTGIIVNPINFRLSANDVQYIASHAESRVFFVHDEFVSVLESVRAKLPHVEQYVSVRNVLPIMPQAAPPNVPAQYADYDKLIADSPAAEPDCPVYSEDIWVLLYTSGTRAFPRECFARTSPTSLSIS